ncbi:hypothetical protein KZZ52_24395 [Dactylosporangium sp. AC04546]|uniref:hypothetical protein n=1 Tax=Dactylosporangium sp. AC04546 TaxID=2862460 RepID=UPI001EDDDDD7|nr:hypothetical protein [Dactylosporangium sp. AC04546]WVK88415.1 hypothetical protein KZZ52_24395 [Dactylosporangium sp. AC04546]
MDLDVLRQAADAGDPEAARELGHRLCVLEEAIRLERPDTVPEAEHWLRRSLAARPDDPVTATLLAGLLVRQHRTALELSSLYDGFGAPGTGRVAWLRSLWGRRAEAFQWYRRALDADPAHAAAANGLALMVLHPESTDDFVYYTGEASHEYEYEDDPDWPAEAARRLRALLAVRPADTMAAASLARLGA